ncbi:penicillin-binding protein activator LpoB [Alteromonas pelagimontana]|uniref:Penicillin-binding protein activator LpoB n=2 Tax=Alteromonas pelagimontana TaxID=1858656 RepID=A0A6M4MJV0_9ALTE|nr:penicillin-binding protein activator LpoB [Alteromonas pelagimontana]
MVAAALFLNGCKSTEVVDTRSGEYVTAGLSSSDFNNAANDALNDIISSPLLVHPQAAQGGRYIMAVSNIINDTSQRIDTDQLTKKIRVGLLNSGKFLTTTAIGLSGAEDEMTARVRELNESKMVNQTTVKKDGQVIAPDFSLSGKIIQRTNRLDRSNQLVDYYFQLTLTQLETGLAYWEGEYPVSKKVSNDSVTW